MTVLEDEIKRDLYLAETLTNLEGDMDPLQSDWELRGELSSSIEDKTDYLFTVPIEILKGCSCKTVEDVVATNLPRGMDALPSLVLANK